MHRIDSSTAVAVMPTPAAAGTAGFFQDANPQTGAVGTVMTADWCNSVMMELVNILTAAGVTPSKTAQNQVLTALQALFGGAGTNGTAGSRTLPGGTIIKWGNDQTAAGTGTKAISFTPLTNFPTACVNVQLTCQTASANAVALGMSAVTNTGFTAWAHSTVAVGFYWLAIGY